MSKGGYNVNGSGRGGQYSGNGWGASGWYGHREGHHASREGGAGKRLETGNLDAKRAFGASQPNTGILVGVGVMTKQKTKVDSGPDFETRRALTQALSKTLLTERKAHGQLGAAEISRSLRAHDLDPDSEIARKVLSHARTEGWLTRTGWQDLDAYEKANT